MIICAPRTIFPRLHVHAIQVNDCMTAVPKTNSDNSIEALRDARSEPFFCWPGKPLFNYYLKRLLIVGIWFKLLFNGSDYIAGLHLYRVPVAMDWELATIPFIPHFTLIYSSIYFSMLLVPFVLRTKHELHAMAMALATVIGLATIVFLVAPTEPAYGPLPRSYTLDWLHEVTKMLALRHNLAPSLHVAMSWLILRTLATKATRPIAFALYGWAAAIALATLLTHQHHVIDVLTGSILAETIYHLVYRRSARHAERMPERVMSVD